MRRRPSDRDKAHNLLQTWGSQYGYVEGIGYPSAPYEPTVQGEKPELSSPEEYADRMDDWAVLDRAVRDVGLESEFHGIILREHYVLGHSERRIADSFSLDVSELKSRLGAAVGAFWDRLPDWEKKGSGGH